jgi:hypothetical protein
VVYTFDTIDLEIEGENVGVYYSWNAPHILAFQLVSPWDIAVPNSVGIHNLSVFAESIEGNLTSAYFEFTIITEDSSISTPNRSQEPLIDGIIGGKELSVLTTVQTNVRTEDRSLEPITLFFGYFNDSLYVGVLTTLRDSYHSRISLFVDSEGDGVWGDAGIGSGKLDICITIPTPSAIQVYKGIKTHYGQDLYPVGLVYDCGVMEEGISAEFLIPVGTIGANSTLGLGVGVVVSHGGYNAFYPASTSTGEIRSLAIISDSGYFSGNKVDSFLVVLGVGAGGVLLVALYIAFESRDSTMNIEDTLEDEHLERIRTLILSHPEISFDRLALLAGSDRDTVRESLERLVEKNLLSYQFVITTGGVAREILTTEKKQK